MFCKNCGKEIDDNANFCDGCGASINGGAAGSTGSKSNEFEKYLLLARRAADSGNNADAAKYYGLAQTDNPNDWESLFYATYHTAMQTNIAGIASAANLVVGAVEPSVSLIKNHISESEQTLAATKLMDSCITISTALFEGAKNHYNGTDSSIRSRFEGEYQNRAFCARSVALVAAAQIEKTFSGDERFFGIIADGYRHAITMYESYSIAFPKNSEQELDELTRIAKYDKDFAAARLQKHIDKIDMSIKKLSKPTQDISGCASGFLFTFAIGIIVIGTVYDGETLGNICYILGAVFGVLGIISVIPFKKNAKQLAYCAARIEELNKQKAKLEALL